MKLKRKLSRIYKPEARNGFLGPGHIARAVINGNFFDSDPFIMLMDDRLDKKDEEPVGGPHPHAGFETVTLMLEGEIGDGNHTMKAGDLQMMTAGSGVVHTETIDKKMKMHLLQLWLSLPKKDRSATPRVQDIGLQKVPSLKNEGVEIKLYSGSFAGMISPLMNYSPMILADITIENGITTIQHLPADYTAFLYVLKGSLKINEEQLIHDQVGWLNRFMENETSDLEITAGNEGVRFILYAGKPTGDPIVSHGPFIADTNEDIIRLYQEYRQGKMKHITTLPLEQTLVYK
jgi:redox-sensitive bicupin YhaK (pirin superfamily)